MHHRRFSRFLPYLFVSAVAAALVADSCAAPSRGGTGSGGGGGGGSSGGGGSTGNGGMGAGPGNGGAGNEVILTGNGGGGGSGGTGGAVVKMACGSATSDPLPYTAGYTPDATNHSNAMSTANMMSNAERAQQMSGLQQSGTANYNVFNQETNSTRNIRGWYFRDGPRGVNLNATADGKQDYATAFPVAIARGASFDVGLE